MADFAARRPRDNDNTGETKMRCAKEVLFTLLAGLLIPQALFAVDAPELRVEHSIVIDAPPEQVWGVVSDFNGLPRWLPVIESSRIILGKNREVGCIRELTRANGTKVQEKLIAYEPWKMSLSYTYIGGQPGASDYYPTMTVKDAGNGKSRVEWKARFRRLAYWTDDPPPGQDDATVLAAFNR
ncbi:MAG: SRPBCC family protein, partial [Burkholderiales bacterium]